MNVKRSSSSIDADASARACGFAPTRAELVEVVEGEDVLEVEPFDLLALQRVLAQDADRLGVVDHVGDVLRGAVHVDRRADGADEAEREVEEHPFETRRGEDREGVALLDPEGQQPVGKLVDGRGGFLA